MNSPFDQFPKLERTGAASRLGAGWLSSPLGRVVGIALGAVMLVGAVFFSAIVVSVLLIAGTVAGGVLWWRTRDLRRQLRSEMERVQAAFEASKAGNRSGSRGDDAAGPGSGAAGAGRRSQAARDDLVIDGDFIRDVDPAQNERR